MSVQPKRRTSQQGGNVAKVAFIFFYKGLGLVGFVIKQHIHKTKHVFKQIAYNGFGTLALWLAEDMQTRGVNY